MTDQLETLLAERDIRQVLTDYCRSVDRLDGDLMLSVFHADGEVFYEGGYQGPPAGLVEVFLVVHLDYEAHSHQITNLTVHVDGDRAVSESYVTARIRSFPDEAGRRRDLVVAGRYLDTWERRDGRWAISYRRQISDVFSQYEVLAPAGPHQPDTAAVSTSRRDREDLSYAHLSSLGTPVG